MQEAGENPARSRHCHRGATLVSHGHRLEGEASNDPGIVVTNEVGLGVVPSHSSGVLFRDLLGTINRRVAAVCDEVHLVIAGRVLKL